MKISTVDFTNNILNEAIKIFASDIHIDPHPDIHTIRFRIHGLLKNHSTIPEEIYLEVISRIKILSGLRTDVHNTPQDGRFKHDTCDIRVSILPCQFGENAVLRILAPKEDTNSFLNLGMSPFDIKRIREVVKKRRGLILVTGPTGSGKTSTLYTLLQKLNSPDTSIITIEDPIEYSIKGIRQIQVNRQYGITFSSGLRSILRQDPNIIMIGEIRDTETARIAVHSALTGHLVLSTLHTNSAADTIPRLFDMGIEPYLISATLSLVIGQRLVRKKTIQDKQPNGRTGIYETLIINEKIRSLIEAKSSSLQIEKASDMKKMNEDAMDKVRSGIISGDEALSTLYEQG